MGVLHYRNMERSFEAFASDTIELARTGCCHDMSLLIFILQCFAKLSVYLVTFTDISFTFSYISTPSFVFNKISLNLEILRI